MHTLKHPTRHTTRHTTRPQVRFVSSERPAQGWAQTPGQCKDWISLPSKKSSWHGKSMCRVFVLTWWQLCVLGACVSDHCHWLCRDIAISDTLFKRKVGKRLSHDARKRQGLDLIPREEKLVARQVNVPCVCTYVMTVVCAWCVC